MGCILTFKKDLPHLHGLSLGVRILTQKVTGLTQDGVYMLKLEGGRWEGESEKQKPGHVLERKGNIGRQKQRKRSKAITIKSMEYNIKTNKHLTGAKRGNSL